MKGSSLSLPILIVSLITVSLLPGSNGHIVEDRGEPVDIEGPVEIPIEYDDDGVMTLRVNVTSEDYPVSVFLIKGEEGYHDWKKSDDVDVEAILNGDEVPDQNITFRVVAGFSRRNVTTFEEELRTDERDTYYVVISLYRDSNMSVEEVRTKRVTLVNYSVEWSFEGKDIPLYLIPVAGLLFTVGAVLLIIYFWPTRRDEESEEAAFSGGESRGWGPKSDLRKAGHARSRGGPGPGIRPIGDRTERTPGMGRPPVGKAPPGRKR